MITLYLCGAGNSEGVRLAQTVNQVHRHWDVIVLLDDDPRKHGTSLLGVPVVGPLSLLSDAGPGSAAVNLVARTTIGRAAVHRRIVATGVPLANLVHPAVDSRDCELGDGVLVYEQAVLSPETRLGDGVVVFMRAVVGHQATVGAGCVLAAGSVLNARVVLEHEVYVGSNASVLPEVHIGRNATVGANTMVAMHVPRDATIVGVPGQLLQAGVATTPVSAAVSGDATPAGLEAQLMELLHRVLGHRNAAPTDRFFDAGGTSLRAIELLAAVHRELGHDVPLPVLYSRCTMRELAIHMLGLPATHSTAQMAHARAAARRRQSQSGVPRPV